MSISPVVVRSRPRRVFLGLATASLTVGLLGCTGSPPPAVPPAPSQAAPSPATTRAEAAAIELSVPESISATEADRADVHAVANAHAFGGEAKGYAGLPVAEVEAVRRLIAHPHAADLLSLIVEQGSRPGQLLALSGLYYADHDRFIAAVARFASIEEPVNVHAPGCMMGTTEEDVATLVKRSDAAQWLDPNETWEAWRARNPNQKELVMDIAGGGYPRLIAGRY